MTRPIRIALIQNMVDPNRVPVVEALARRDDCDVLAVYETVVEKNRSWAAPSLRFPHVVLQSRTVDLLALGTDAYVHVPWRPLAPLVRFAPDVVVAAGGGVWSSPANVAALLARPRRKWAFVPWWGSFEKQSQSRGRRIAEAWVRRFVRSGDAWIAYGSRARAELVRLGADPRRIVISPNAAGVFPSRPRAWPPSTPRRFLFVGQLIERKGLPQLLEAFARVERAELVVAGDGPLRAAVETAARADARITYAGPADWSRLGELYAAADALVLPSLYEVWGLVVNEALAHGLAAIVSDQVGAADDLVEEGTTGYVVPAGSVERLTEAMRTVASWSDAEFRTCADRAAATLAEWSVQHAADGVFEACRLALERRRTTADAA